MAAWTNDLIAEARRLWEEGYSARLIADRLGEGFTKNAVIGKAHRQKWGQRRTAYQRPNPLNERIKAGKIAKAKARTHAAPKPPPPPPAPPPPPKPRLPPGTYTLLDLRPHECKWPVNSPPKGGGFSVLRRADIRRPSLLRASRPARLFRQGDGAAA